MITDIQMSGVACFKNETSLVTDKKINLVYGLNGTGKSTISNFLYDPHDPEFKQCSFTKDQSAQILVYNQRFIRDTFFVSDNLKGIFSLSKENKAAKQKIADAEKKQNELNQSLQEKCRTKEQQDQEFSEKKRKAEETVWEIKTDFAGGDRVLEYCLEGLKGDKEKLFVHLKSIAKPATEPEKPIQALRKEAEELKNDDAQPQEQLTTLSFQAHDAESDQILGTSIIGNADSEVAALIEHLGNSDWVKQGLGYLPDNLGEAEMNCPFCQKITISAKFVESMKSYFDLSYQKKLDALNGLLKRYEAAIETLPKEDSFVNHPAAKERNSAISSDYKLLIATLNRNVGKIKEKIKSPKTMIVLSDTTAAFADFNAKVVEVNKDIDEYNKRLRNRETALIKLKDEFWQLMRWKYDQTISRFEHDQHAASLKLKSLDGEINKINSDLAKVKEQITEAQAETVNVDTAVDAINAGLSDLGIDEFSVKKHSETLYRVVRTGDSNDAFQSLSEGEKMIISFLYFCELCKGKSGIDDTHAQRIVVIDDPISSLSHIFIFNVGQLIRSLFFKGERFCQVIVLTHSLYFFYELTDRDHKRREKIQKLFRLSKPSSGSIIREMKYEEIQNDYHAFWSVVNDPDHPPALIANCMRNIVEYFFSFVRKKDLNNVFQMPELGDTKYQAFCRYVNRESHSLGQNIMDMKEFDYGNFKEGLRLVFEKTGYLDHFEEMSKC